jgi:hypothetical protein
VQAERQTRLATNYAKFLAVVDAFAAGERGAEQGVAGDGKFSSAAGARVTE